MIAPILRALALLCLFVSPAWAYAADEAKFLAGLDQINSSKLKQVAKGVDTLIESKDPAADLYLKALLASELYRHKKEKRLVLLVEKVDKQFVIADPNDTSLTQTVKKRAVKRVPINNKLRGKIKSYLASMGLNSDSADKRLSAARQLLNELGDDEINLFKQRLEVEQNPDVTFVLKTGVALDTLKNGETYARLEAIDSLGESLEPAVRNALTDVAANGDDELANAASKALAKIEGKVEFYGFLEKIFFGLSLGSVLVLAAIGLAITFGVMGCINMAHGELIMIGAYTTYVIQLLMPNSIGASLIVAVPAAFVVSGLVGILIERGIIQFLKGRPLETLLATFGVSLVLQQTVRSIFSPLNRSVETPDWMSGALEINPIFAITYNRLYIIFFCLAVFALLFVVLRKTVLGLQVRAVSQNRNMAQAMGVKSEWVDALTFGLGSGIAGVAGVALSQLTNVGPNLGQSYIIDSFMVVVFGGVGNLWGTLVAGMSLGVANKMLEPVSGAVLAKILVLIFIILFIQKKPRGLFPQKGRAAED